MDKNVKRVLVEKRNGFDLEARALKKDIEESLHITPKKNLEEEKWIKTSKEY